MTLSSAEIAAWMGQFYWPFLRISAMFVLLPIFGARTVPVRLRIVIAVALSVLIAPLVEEIPAVDPLSAEGLLIAGQQLLIGLSLNFIVQMVFGAVALGGQVAANSMGLGFASMVDPTNGVQVPILSQFYLILATLIFLVVGGHLVLVQILVESFRTLPIAIDGISRNSIWQVLQWAGVMFAGSVLIAMPMIAALLLVNLSFGVITRAAPQLNIFAVGFPLSMTLGFVLIWVSLPHLLPQFDSLLVGAFEQLRLLIGGP